MAFTAQQTAGIKKQYDPLRKRAQQQESANLQGQNDAMSRRAAAQGGGPGGAYEKQAQLAQTASAERLQSANEGINAQEQGAVNQAREVQAQRDYGTSERVAGQKFASGERLGSQDFAERQRLGSQDFSKGERLGTQDWQATQAAEQRKFVSGERQAGQKWQTGERADAQRQQDRQFQEQLGRDWERFQHEKFVDDFNMQMAEKMFNKKDLLEQLFGNFSGSSISSGWKSVMGGGLDDSVFGGEGGM